MLLISPTEHDLSKILVGESNIATELWGVDVLGAGACLWGVQRKKFPADFMASTRDGRLAREVVLMQRLGAAFLVLEGSYGEGQEWPRSGLRNYLRTITMLGIVVEWTDNLQDTADTCRELVEYFRPGKEHGSVLVRPKGIDKNSWGEYTKRAEQEYLLQGFSGIGAGTARKIIDHFGRLPLEWDCTEEDMRRVPGIGKKTVGKIWSVLE